MTKQSVVKIWQTAIILLTLFTLVIASPAQNTIDVEAATQPSGNWKKYPTSTLAQSPELSALSPDSNLDCYGGCGGRRLAVTGFFYVTNVFGRWWLVDPLGHLFIHK